MSCMNCAYSLNDLTNECMECDICIRNPKLVSRKFIPVEYKDFKIAHPIDMFISREHKKLVEEEIRKMYEEGVRRGSPVDNTFGYWGIGLKYSMTLLKIDNMKISYDSNSTLTLTYTIMIMDKEPLKESDLKIADKLGQIIEEKKISKERTVTIDIIDILKDMEGMEIGEDQ